jgi:aminoglycoside phosphotransferase family enzyme/predicted kinase
LTESDVYKVKKPVVFPFLDYGTPEARARACEAEVVLNQRLAAGAYFGVVPVRRDRRGRHHFGPNGEVVDWAVHMLRIPDALRADVRLANGTLRREDVDAVAEHIADFHGRARADAETAAWGAPDAIARNVTESFDETRDDVERFLEPGERDELETYQLETLASRRDVFERRAAEGRVRDGHGDLRLEHVYLGERGEITILDCIEFSDRFRCADVCADVAFLSMDLAAHGRVDLSERLLARYARASNDWDMYRVVDFYESYRAYVRAKIAALRARGASTDAARAAAEADARRHFALALSSSRKPLLRPIVVAVGGTIASGKSTVAEAVAERLSAPIVDADRTRKHLLGVAPTTPLTTAAFGGAYDPRVTERVYAEVLFRGSLVLGSGRPVVLDASFRTAEMRLAARELAREHGVPFVMIECRARPEVCRERLARRERERSGSGAVSDGRREIFDAFAARFEPMDELAAGERLVVDTERPLDETLADVARHVATWPEGLVA